MTGLVNSSSLTLEFLQISTPTTSSSPPNTLTAIEKALSIPEILLRIFESTNTQPFHHSYHLPESSLRNPTKRALALFARVSSLWRGPAEEILYSDICVPWCFSAVSFITSHFSLKRSNYDLVKSCTIRRWDRYLEEAEIERDFDWPQFLKSNGYEWDIKGDEKWQEAWRISTEERRQKVIELTTGGEFDSRVENIAMWAQEGEGTQSCVALIKFLKQLSNLRHLQISGNARETILPLAPSFCSLSPIFIFNNLRYILYRLKSFILQGDWNTALTFQLLQLSSCIKSLSVIHPHPEFYLPPLPNLRLFTFECDLMNMRQGLELDNRINLVECLNTKIETVHILDTVTFGCLTHVHLMGSSQRWPNFMDLQTALFKTSPTVYFLSLSLELEGEYGCQVFAEVGQIIPPAVKRVFLLISTSTDTSKALIQCVRENLHQRITEVQIFLMLDEGETLEDLIGAENSEGRSLLVRTVDQPDYEGWVNPAEVGMLNSWHDEVAARKRL